MPSTLKLAGVPVFSGALFGHIRRKFTLPVGLDAEVDADAGSTRLLQPAVTRGDNPCSCAAPCS